jgi:hypothetical protein
MLRQTKPSQKENALSLALFGEELKVYGVILEYEEVSEMSIP